MTDIDRSKPILVTGAGGYIASWIVRYLLEDGLTVHATVRDQSNSDKIGHLTHMGDETPGTLKFFEADLTREGSFDEAMQGCEVVMHTASPFFIEKPKDVERDLVGPARDGTRIVLEAANRVSTVKRIVLTSSVAAVMGDATDAENAPNRTLDESYWNETSTASHNPYQYSKTLAEREAWKMAEAQNRWDLLAINPSFVLGPALSTRGDSTSVNFIRDLVSGKVPGCPPLYFGLVDVRDVARAHILAAFTPGASGRHITSAVTMSFLEIANTLRETFGTKYKIPGKELPTFLLYIVGPLFGLTWEYLSKNAGVSFDLDHAYSRRDLGLEYRPIAETLAESVEQLDRLGML